MLFCLSEQEVQAKRWGGSSQFLKLFHEVPVEPQFEPQDQAPRPVYAVAGCHGPAQTEVEDEEILFLRMEFLQ